MSRKVFNNVFVANSSKCELILSGDEYYDGNTIAITNENYKNYFNFSLIEVSVTDIILNVYTENQFGYAKINSFVFPIRINKNIVLNGDLDFYGCFEDENSIRTSFSIRMNSNGEVIGEHNKIEIIDKTLENQE